MGTNGTRGLFISLEGISGCGKSTLAKKLLVPFLQSRGIESVHNAKPSSANAFGLAIRMVIERQAFTATQVSNLRHAIVTLLHESDPFNGTKEVSDYFYDLAEIPDMLEQGEPLTELDRQFLFLADEATDITKIIVPKLESGTWVIQDRFHLSGAAYGSVKGELTPADIYKWREVVLREKIIVPDITFFIEVSPETACERLRESGKIIDIYEGVESLRGVSVQYEKAIAVASNREGEKNNVVRVNGELPLEGVFAEVRRALEAKGLI